MSSLETPQAGQVVTLRLYKRLATNGSIEWSNSYELQDFEATGDVGRYSDMASLMAGAEALIHKTNVQYVRAVVSTYTQDGKPNYNPQSFYVKDLSGLNGVSLLPAQMLSLHNCLVVNKQTDFGRSGRSMYRGCLDEGMIYADSGYPVLEGAAYAATSLTVVAMQTAMTATLQATNWRLVLASGQPLPDVRAVTSLGLSPRITVKKFNNRYYDRVAV